LFVFDEELNLLFDRMKTVNIDLEGARDEGRLIIEQIDAAELSPGEFALRVRRIVDHENLHTVVIDSLNGYQAAQGVLRGVPQYAGGRAPLLADENP